MRKFLTVTVLLMAAMLILSCSDGSGSAEATGPVQVNFSVQTLNDSFRTVNVGDSTTDFTYEYAAVPQWEGDDFTDIYGATSAYGTDARPTYADLGAATGSKYFAQGSWKFYARVKMDGQIVYQSSATPAVTYISTSSHTVNIDVARVGGNGSATISVDIEIPTNGMSNLTANYEGQATGSITLNTNTPATRAGYTRFKGSADLDSGAYTFTFATTDRGGAVVAFDVLPGDDRTITGTIESGEFQSTAITIVLPGTFTVTVSGPSTVAPSSSNNTYTCNAIAGATYQWYVGSEAVGTNSNTYAYTAPSAEQYVNIYCKVTKDGYVASNGFPVTVETVTP